MTLDQRPTPISDYILGEKKGPQDKGLPVVIRRLEQQRDAAVEALREFIEMTEEPPEPNCSCHISPPCRDCVDYSGLRSAFTVARATLAEIKGEG